MRCLIINGMERGLLLDVRQPMPEIRVAHRPRPIMNITRRVDLPECRDPIEDRVYKVCFRGIDGEMALYSRSGSSLDILAEQEWLVPRRCESELRRGGTVLWVSPGVVILDPDLKEQK